MFGELATMATVKERLRRGVNRTGCGSPLAITSTHGTGPHLTHHFFGPFNLYRFSSSLTSSLGR